VLAEGTAALPEDSVLAAIQERKGFIDGVVISGGEPTIHKGLADFISKIKSLGLAVKLDTNGYKPKALKERFANKVLD